MTWAEGRRLTTEPPRRPGIEVTKKQICVCTPERLCDFIKIVWLRVRESTSRRSGREKQAPCQAGSPTRSLIPGPQDHNLG